MFEFMLPDLGEGIHEGEILKWHVEPGAVVKEDEPLVDMETDKAAVTIPAPRSGRIVSTNGKVGARVSVGTILAVIDDSGESLPASAGPAASPTTTPRPEVAPTPAPAPARAPLPVPAAPSTRRLARELGVDINLVPGSGPGGRVTPEDVQRFAAGRRAAMAERPTQAAVLAPAELGRRLETAATAIPFLEIEPLPDFAEQGPVEREPVRSIRRKVARKMTTSMILVPHVAHMDEADVTALDEFRRSWRERHAGEPGSRLSLLPFLVKAVAATLKEFPSFNASLDPFREEIIYKKFYHVGIAVDSGHGLLVPVIRDADRKSILAIAREIEDLAARARTGKIEAPEMRGGTFTITNVGPLGGTALIPTINYPEVAILGTAKASPKPVVRNGSIVPRTILPLTLAYDHRVADGADAARFVSRLVERLSEPLSWLITIE